MVFAFADAIVAGILHPDGTHKLNPPHDLVVKPNDRIIVIAEDNDTYEVNMVDYNCDNYNEATVEKEEVVMKTFVNKDSSFGNENDSSNEINEKDSSINEKDSSNDINNSKKDSSNDDCLKREFKPLFKYTHGAFGGIRPPQKRPAETILICGWRRDFGDFIVGLDNICFPGTEVVILFKYENNLVLINIFKRLEDY